MRPLADFHSSDVVPIWPAPDMTILNGGRRSPVQMPSGLFGPAWPIIQGIAEGTSTPVDYPAAGFLAACASLIGGKRRAQPYRSSNWSEPCIIWTAVVGDPSSRKSPALEAVTSKLAAIEAESAERHKLAITAWQEVAQRAKASRLEWEKAVAIAAKDGLPTPPMPSDASEPEEPQRRRTVIQDATPEAVAGILASNPVGTLHFRDELSGWLTSFDRYSPGGREFWLEAYGGRPFVVDRKGSKQPIIVPFNGVSVAGGIQPAKLASALLASPDDGLVARFLMFWPDKVTFTRPRAAADMEGLERIYRRLDSLAWATGENGELRHITLPLSDKAADVFEAWQKDNAGIDDDATALLKSFVGKMDGTVIRLALVAELIGWAVNGGTEPVEVSVSSLMAAAEWVDDYAKPMAERVYGDAALPDSERNAAILARYIRKASLRAINKRELRRSPHKSKLPGLRERSALDDAIAYLVDAGWLREAHSRDGGTTGRQREDYMVNPAVLESVR